MRKQELNLQWNQTYNSNSNISKKVIPAFHHFMLLNIINKLKGVGGGVHTVFGVEQPLHFWI